MNKLIHNLILYHEIHRLKREAKPAWIGRHFCRKADPESKGKIENVVKYIKYNFLRGRKYIDNETLNGQALAWLERTANAKTHAATKKIPHQEWLIEKQLLHTWHPEKIRAQIRIPDCTHDNFCL